MVTEQPNVPSADVQHVRCGCHRQGATEIDLLDHLVNVEGMSQMDASRMLWDDRDPRYTIRMPEVFPDQHTDPQEEVQ